MIRILRRTGSDVSYYFRDPANELDGVRDGPAGWWIRGTGPCDPDSVARVLTPGQRTSTTGYDIVVAAPRPISILLALSGDAGAVVRAHRHAVLAALRYLESRGLVIRDRRFGGDVEEPAQWSRIVGFTHGVNRHGEPHLHDHVIVGSRPVGDTTVLQRRVLGAYATSADALYRATLRIEIARTTSWRPWRSFHGVEHVAGVDEGYRALWGGHFDNRPEKSFWRRDDIVRKWEKERAHFEPVAVVREPSRSRSVLDEQAFARSILEHQHITRPVLVEAWCDAASFGLDPEGWEAAFDARYPDFRQEYGSRLRTLSLDAALQRSLVNERGPRPLTLAGDSEWRGHPARERRAHEISR